MHRGGEHSNCFANAVVGAPLGRESRAEAAKRGPGNSVPQLPSGRLPRHPDLLQQPHHSSASAGPGETIAAATSRRNAEDGHGNILFLFLPFFLSVAAERPDFSQAAVQRPVLRRRPGNGESQTARRKREDQGGAAGQHEHVPEQERPLLPSIHRVCAGTTCASVGLCSTQVGLRWCPHTKTRKRQDQCRTKTFRVQVKTRRRNKTNIRGCNTQCNKECKRAEAGFLFGYYGVITVLDES